MNVQRFNQDLLIAQSEPHIRGVDWSIDPADMWVIIYGGVYLPPGQFNQPDVNLKLPVPSNLYDPVRGDKGKYHFYRDVFIDPSLKILDKNGKWRKPRRLHASVQLKKLRVDPDWAFLCVIPRHVGPYENILTLLAQVQRYLLHHA